MVDWTSLFGAADERGRHRIAEEARRLLPVAANELPPSALPAKEVTKVALRLKYQIEQVIPYELDDSRVTGANSTVITQKVIKCAKEAGGEEYRACVVYCLLVCKRWFKKQALLELWDSDLHKVRAIACEIIAKHIIEEEEDQEFLLQEMLMKRFSIVKDNDETEPANAIEYAVDLHALRVIGSSGYQKAVKYLWRGWIVQDDKNAGTFINYKNRDSTNYWVHLDPDRMRTPLYQNTLQIIMSLVYLGLYTGAVNTVNEDGDLDIVEGILYVMTLGFVCDEIAKLWKVGRQYFGFWNAFNSCLYALLTTSFVIRMLALTQSSDEHNEKRQELNKLGYHFFAFSAPMFWLRLLLNFDTIPFFGAMLVVLKKMMRESLIFFALLVIICIGFLQAFVGLNQAEGNHRISSFVMQAMLNSVMQSPSFEGFEDYAHPFGVTLYYIYTFVVMVILLNILVALYNSAYSNVTDNAIDEYMALSAQKTMNFVRAPDENVFIAPFNLVELIFLIIPLEWWMDTHRYEVLNNYVMGFLYAPFLFFTAFYETREAHRVRFNRKRGEEDDDTIEEWEQLENECDFENEGWAKKVESTRPHLEQDANLIAIGELKKELAQMKEMLRGMSVEPENGKPDKP